MPTYAHTRHTHSNFTKGLQRYGGTAELKILIVICYYITLVVFSVIAFTIITEDIPDLRDDLMQYFTCESLGVNSGLDCQRDTITDRVDSEIHITMSFILTGLLPYVHLIYIINSDDIKHVCEWICGKGETGSSERKNDSGTNASMNGSMDELKQNESCDLLSLQCGTIIQVTVYINYVHVTEMYEMYITA